MREIKAIIRPLRLPAVLRALHEIRDLPGVTVSTVRGIGRVPPAGADADFDEVEMTKLEVVVPATIAAQVVAVIARAAHTGRLGDGKIFTLPVEHALKIRSGEQDLVAL